MSRSHLLENRGHYQTRDGSRDQSQHQRGHGQQEERGRRLLILLALILLKAAVVFYDISNPIL